MNLYLVERLNMIGWDQYESMVVAARCEEEAKEVTPREDMTELSIHSEWVANPRHLKVKLLGTAVQGTKVGVILASYKAG